MGSGVDSYVIALTLKDGTLYMGGAFTTAGGGAADDSYVAAWNGTTWSSLGAGVNSLVNALATHDDTLYVGGNFDDTGTVPFATSCAAGGMT